MTMTKTTMQALMSDHAGGPDSLVLREIPVPVPGPKEVRVVVKACGINYPDALIVEDGQSWAEAFPPEVAEARRKSAVVTNGVKNTEDSPADAGDSQGTIPSEHILALLTRPRNTEE